MSRPLFPLQSHVARNVLQLGNAADGLKVDKAARIIAVRG